MSDKVRKAIAKRLAAKEKASRPAEPKKSKEVTSEGVKETSGSQG